MRGCLLGAVGTGSLALALALAPAVTAAAPGFTPVHLMPTILGIPSTTSEAYASVSCPTRSSCTAVGPGFLINSQSFSPLGTATAVTETDGVWGGRVALPLPSDAVTSTATSSALSSVRCTSAGSCTGVGSYPVAGGNLAPLIETEHGGRWIASTVSLPGGTVGSARLSSVWCASSARCAAFGSFQPSGENEVPIVVVEAHGRWGGPVELSPPISGGFMPLSIACSGGGDCVAVAIGGQSVASTTAWTERAGSWGHPETLPQPRSMQFLGLSIACPTETTCLLAGGLIPSAPSANQDMYPAVRTDDAGAWSPPRQLPEPVVTPVMTEGLLTSVSCATATTCEAVGGFVSNSGTSRARPGAYTWAGGQWSSPSMIRGVPLGGKMAFQSYFTAVSCASPDACLAIGPVRRGPGKGSLAGAFFAGILPARVATAPSPPTAVRVRTEHGGLIVTWSPPLDDGGDPVASYTVSVNAGLRERSTRDDSCAIDGLTDGERYRVTVTATSAAGESAPTAPVSVVTPR